MVAKKNNVKVATSLKNANTLSNAKKIKSVKLNSKLTLECGKVITRGELLAKVNNIADVCMVHCDNHGTGNGVSTGKLDSVITGRDLKKALENGMLNKEDMSPAQYKAVKKIRLNNEE